MKTLLAVTGLILFTISAAAQDARQINWLPSLDAALVEAKKRNVPVFVAINNDYAASEGREKIEANRQMALVCYRNLEVVKATRRFVCVVASQHARPLDVPDDNQECRRFGKITYAQLRVVTTAIRSKFFPGETEMVAPQHLILDPTGRLIDRFLLSRKPKELVALLGETLARFRGEAPARTVAGDTASVLKGLKSRDDKEREAAFKQALALLTADKDNKAVADAAAQHLRKLKDYMAVRRALEMTAATGAEGPLALLLPYLKHRNARVRRSVLDVFARSKPCEPFIANFGQVARSERVEGPLRALVGVLDKYANEFKEALSHLNRMISSKQPSVKVLATFAAARPGNKAIYGKLLSRSKKEANLLVRTAAILGLAQMKAKKALPTLEAVRKRETKNPVLVRALDIAIAQLGGTPGEKPESTLEDEAERVKRESGSGGDEGGRGGGRGGGGGGGGRGGGGRGGGGGGRGGGR